MAPSGQGSLATSVLPPRGKGATLASVSLPPILPQEGGHPTVWGSSPALRWECDFGSTELSARCWGIEEGALGPLLSGPGYPGRAPGGVSCCGRGLCQGRGLARRPLISAGRGASGRMEATRRSRLSLSRRRPPSGVRAGSRHAGFSSGSKWAQKLRLTRSRLLAQ